MSLRAAARSRAHLLAPVAVVAMVFALPAYGIWRMPGPPMEEGFMLVFPERLLAGDLPNRDFLHLYGPGSLWVLAAVFWGFGTTLWVQRAVGALQILALAGGVFAVLRPWGRWVAAAGASTSLLVVVTPTGFTALAWVGGVAFGVWALSAGLDALDHGAASAARRRRLTASGLLAGAALLYRLDLALALGLSLGLLLLQLDPAGRRRLVGASLVGVSPYLVHLATAGVGNVVSGMFLEPVFDLRGGRSLPLPPSADGFDGYLQRAWLLPEVRPPYPLPAFSGPVQMRLWFFALLLASAVLVVAGVLAYRRHQPRLLVLAVFAAGLLPQALQRADSTHLAWVSCVTFGLLPAAVIELAGGRHRPRVWTRVVAIAVAPALLLVVAPHFTYRSYGESVAQTMGRRLRTHPMTYEGRTFLYGRAEAADAVNALLPLVDDLTEPGDRLFVGPGDLRRTPYSEAYLYFMLPDLVPATRYIEMDPGVANAEGSGLADELRAADVAILSTIRDDWNEPNDSLVDGPDEPNRVLAGDFCLEETFGEGDDGRGLFEVYRRC